MTFQIPDIGLFIGGSNVTPHRRDGGGGGYWQGGGRFGGGFRGGRRGFRGNYGGGYRSNRGGYQRYDNGYQGYNRGGYQDREVVPPVKVPDEDFDFTENLAKFNKSELTSKAENVEQVNQKELYWIILL